MNTDELITQGTELKINPGRVLFGLSRIGYTPASAICDIIDNAVMAEAKNIHVEIIRESDKYSDSRRGNVKEYLIIDDGKGMNDNTILRALELGSSDEFYGSTTLSKFGLGLKSATFSQGDELEVISATNGVFLKYVVSLTEVQSQDRYFAKKEPISEYDQTIINDFLSEGHGTIIRIGKVRKEGHPSINSTVEELRKKIGVIYYYFIEEGLKITVDKHLLPAIDILFTEEANINGNLDENTWNGRDVKWIEKAKSITLDSDTGVKATIEVTQLPHPPTFRIDERGGDLKIRNKYLIDADNYGYYVYRNKRLISWSQHFKGIIPYNQDLYSFRGRILIDDSADDVFNIDVKKSTITLSDDAWNTISDQSYEYKRKSIKAWNRAKSLLKEKENEDPNQQSNTLVDELEVPETLPGLHPVDNETAQEVEKEVIETSKRRLEIAKKLVKDDTQMSSSNEDSSMPDNSNNSSTADITTTALKGEANPYATKIFRVPYTEDNTLWEPYYDSDNGHCVRINKFHRFSKLVFENNSANTDLQIILELMIHQLAVSEFESLKHLKSAFPKVDVKDLAKIIAEFRRLSSEYLANMCRKLEDKLPPIN